MMAAEKHCRKNQDPIHLCGRCIAHWHRPRGLTNEHPAAKPPYPSKEQTACVTHATCSVVRCGPMGRLRTVAAMDSAMGRRQGTGDRRQGTGISIRTAEVGRDGIVDEGQDAVVGKVFLESVAPGMADDEEVPNGGCPRSNRWQNDFGFWILDWQRPLRGTGAARFVYYSKLPGDRGQGRWEMGEAILRPT